jgi:hypothetical protein
MGGVEDKPRAETAAQAEPDKILGEVCPDIELADDRIDELETRRT